MSANAASTVFVGAQLDLAMGPDYLAAVWVGTNPEARVRVKKHEGSRTG